MRIVHVSRSDLAGGAALAAYRLHTALRGAGEDSTMLVEMKYSGDETVHAASLSRHPAARLRRNLVTRGVRRDARRYVQGCSDLTPLFSDDRAAFGGDLAAQIPSDAIVTLHWIARFVDLEGLLRTLGPGRKVVWRLADMNPFTGGCHYDGGCGRFRDSCGMCPLLLAPSPGDLSHQVWRRRHAALDVLSDEQLHVVAISRQWAKLARASSLLGRFPVSVIPPAVDADVLFKPVGMAAARRELGLEPETTVLVFVAQVLDSPTKGADLLVEALCTMPAHVGDLTLLTVGHGTMPEIDARITHVNLGPSDDSRLAATAYNCADLAVLPSRQEAFGQVVIEAMACGVPVVGFASGGVLDAVADGVTGFVAPEVTAGSLRSALLRALGDRPALRAMRQSCRQVVERRFAAGVVAGEYQALYRSLAGGTPVRRATSARMDLATGSR